MIGQDKRAALKRRMVDLGILEDDLIERFIRGTGHGGQKINKTSSCVYLHHQPSGIEIKCQAQRSREMNRFLARPFFSKFVKAKLEPNAGLCRTA